LVGAAIFDLRKHEDAVIFCQWWRKQFCAKARLFFEVYDVTARIAALRVLGSCEFNLERHGDLISPMRLSLIGKKKVKHNDETGNKAPR